MIFFLLLWFSCKTEVKIWRQCLKLQCGWKFCLRLLSSVYFELELLHGLLYLWKMCESLSYGLFLIITSCVFINLNSLHVYMQDSVKPRAFYILDEYSAVSRKAVIKSSKFYLLLGFFFNEMCRLLDWVCGTLSDFCVSDANLRCLDNVGLSKTH